MTSAARPFAFDTDFGGSGPVIAVAETRRKRVYLAEEVDALQAEAFARGEAGATARAAEVEAQAIAELARSVEAGLSVLSRIAHDHKSASADIALKAAAIIAGGALERFPEAPIRAAIEALTREIDCQPRLVVRSPGTDSVREAVQSAAARSGFAGQLAFRDEPGAPASFVLEWPDGRAAFDPAAVQARIAEAFAATLAAEGLHGEPLTPSSGADNGL